MGNNCNSFEFYHSITLDENFPCYSYLFQTTSIATNSLFIPLYWYNIPKIYLHTSYIIEHNSDVNVRFLISIFQVAKQSIVFYSQNKKYCSLHWHQGHHNIIVTVNCLKQHERFREIATRYYNDSRENPSVGGRFIKVQALSFNFNCPRL